IRREVGFAGGAVNPIRIGGVESQRADVGTGPDRPAALPARAAIGAAPDSARRRAGPQTPGIVGMDDQRGDAPRDIEWAGALPSRQLGIRGLRAPSPEVFQVAGWGVVKRLAGALREPRAVALQCGEFVLHHVMPLPSLKTIAPLRSRLRSEPRPLGSDPSFTISCRTFRSTSRRCASGAPASRGA